MSENLDNVNNFDEPKTSSVRLTAAQKNLRVDSCKFISWLAGRPGKLPIVQIASPTLEAPAEEPSDVFTHTLKKLVSVH